MHKMNANQINRETSNKLSLTLKLNEKLYWLVKGGSGLFEVHLLSSIFDN